MKRSTKAATLSFLVPGAGLWYLGEHRHAVINLIVAAILSVLAVLSGHEHLHWAFLAIAAGSSGYAHAAARLIDQRPGADRPHRSDPTTSAGC